jgi:small-conductance mechanosensitive channel
MAFAVLQLRALDQAAAWAAAHGFGVFDLVVFSFNVALFLAAGPIVRLTGAASSEEDLARRATRLRIANLVLFLLYFVAYFVNDLARPLAETGLTLLLGVLAATFLNGYAVRRHGREREIEGVAYRSSTYQSQLFTMVGIGIVVLVCGLVILNVWGRDNWLQATSVLGGILVALYATKDVWLPDNIAALILLHDGEVSPGAVIQSEELGLFGIVLRTTLTRTIFKDLIHRHDVIVPNRRLRTARLDVLSQGPGAGCWYFADFNVGYDVDPTAVEEMLTDAWTRACEIEKGVSAERPPKIRVLATADHAVTWRLLYGLGNVYRLLPARYAIQRGALDASRAAGITLATPLTHEVELSPRSSADCA